MRRSASRPTSRAHLKLMFDLQVLAYKSEITRISTLMFARENSNAVYPATGVRDGFHNASHHSNERKNMDQFAVINRYHVKMLAYFLERLRSTPDGDGTLLDHSMILYGSSLSDGNEHNFDPLPVVAGRRRVGPARGGRHLRHAPHTPMSNLLLAMLHKMGARVDAIGDSTAPALAEGRLTERRGTVCSAGRCERRERSADEKRRVLEEFFRGVEPEARRNILVGRPVAVVP